MKQFKGFILGIIFAVALMAIPAVAETIEKTITVLPDYVTIQVDGETKNVRNFVSEGTTYIAIRDISEVLGYEVGWDDATRVASINTGKAVDETAISVNDAKIGSNKFSSMFDLINTYYQGSGMAKEDIINFVKDELVTQEVVNQKAESLKLVDKAKLKEDAESDLVMLDMQYGKETTDQLLQAYYGYKSRDEFIESTVSQSINNAVFEYLEKNEPDYAAVTEGAKDYYEQHKEEFKEHSVQVKHILIPTTNLETGAELSEDELKAAEALANKIAGEATPENFDSLIAEYNNDPGMPAEGYTVTGDSTFVPEFEAAALAFTAPGQISKPVKTSYGYHILIATAINEYMSYDKFLTNYTGEKFGELDMKFIRAWVDEAKVVYFDDVINKITSK